MKNTGFDDRKGHAQFDKHVLSGCKVYTREVHSLENL